MSEQEEQQSFEVQMDKLEKIVRRLEESDVPLEEAMALFQEGMQLSKRCHQKLQTIEKDMDRIIEDDEFKPFVVQEDDEV